MRKTLILLLLTLLASAFSVKAETLLTAEKGYGLSLTKVSETVDWTKPNTDMQGVITAERSKQLYLIGPFVNMTGKDQSIRFGVEFKEVATGECYYCSLIEKKEFVSEHQLVSISFEPSFVIRNGLYEVRAVCMDMSKDESITTNWEPVAVPAGFSVPQVKITGDEPIAYFPTQPYIGNQRNVVELSDAQLHFSLATLSAIEKGELYVFVFESGNETSIGYFKQSFSQKAGVTKEYIVEYTKSGSQAADLEVGKTYDVEFRFFEDRKEQVFDWRYDGMKFSVVENGSAIPETFEDYYNSTNGRMLPGRKFMLEDGSVIIGNGLCKYGISGIEIK